MTACTGDENMGPSATERNPGTAVSGPLGIDAQPLICFTARTSSDVVSKGLHGLAQYGATMLHLLEALIDNFYIGAS